MRYAVILLSLFALGGCNQSVEDPKPKIVYRDPGVEPPPVQPPPVPEMLPSSNRVSTLP
jgi:hypothetical protein